MSDSTSRGRHGIKPARGLIVPRPRGMPIDELVSARRNRSHLKARLIPNCHSQTENVAGRAKRRRAA
jgi:hypothetical protein